MDNQNQKYYSRLAAILRQSIPLDVQEETNLPLVFSLSRLNKGDFITREGDIPDKLSFVYMGAFKYFYLDEDGNEFIKHFCFEDDFVVSYASFLYRTPSRYYIQALEDAILLSTHIDIFLENIEKHRTWERLARLYTEQIYLFKEIREYMLLTKNAEQRYLHLLRDFPEIAKRIKQKDIASYLGITPVTLSRIRKKLDMG